MAYNPIRQALFVTRKKTTRGAVRPGWYLGQLGQTSTINAVLSEWFFGAESDYPPAAGPAIWCPGNCPSVPPCVFATTGSVSLPNDGSMAVLTSVIRFCTTHQAQFSGGTPATSIFAALKAANRGQ